MADTQSHTPGVIRCTQDYLQAPDTLAPELLAPDSPAPESLAPDSPAPESLAPDSPAHESLAPDSSAPESLAPDSSAPELLAPDSSTLESLAPDSSAPESLAPDSSAPESLAPDSSAPESLTPDLLAPTSQAPDSLAPESLASESSLAPESPGDSEDARVPSPISTISGDDDSTTVSTTRESPREVRNRAEKMRRDRLNKSVAQLASMVPPVVASRRKIDKTTVLRLTAHYLRAHQYVFGDSIGQSRQRFSSASILKMMSLFNGFLITTTYRGIIVVVSQNVHQYLGYSELDLLGQNLFDITHEGDRAILREQLMPRTQTLGPNGELMIPDEPDAIRKVKEALAHEKRRFIIRLKKLGQRSEPSQYVTCHVEGSLRKSDRACRGYNRCCQIVRRARARSENPCSSGNDIVFIGMVRPMSESFINESAIESYRMEYRTRHSIDGEIIQCESRIALVTGYMTHEVSGVNAMNFMHRDDVRWVIIALREMYDQHRVFGESCYRLITKNGQMVYMRTRGCLDVDRESRAVTSFVCTNTVVDEEEGKQLIKMMKRKFTLLVNNNEGPTIQEIDDDTHDDKEQNEDEPAPVEDPKRLEQVILHLVTNLPSPSPQDSEAEPFAAASPERKNMSPHRLTIIPPNKERIVSAIEKIYGIKNFQRDHNKISLDLNREEKNYNHRSAAGSSHTMPQYIQPVEMNSIPTPREAQMVRQDAHMVRQEAHRVRRDSQILVPFHSAHVSNCVQLPDNFLAPLVDNYSDNDNNSDDILNAVASPDVGYFDDVQSPFSNISSIFANINQNGEEMFNELQVAQMQELEYRGAETDINMPMPQYAEESNVYQALPQASLTNFFPCGTKRPNNFEDIDMVYKKKIIGTEFFRQGEPISDLQFLRQNDSDLELLRQNEPISDLEFLRQNEPDSDFELLRQNETISDSEFLRQNELDSDIEFLRQQEPTSDFDFFPLNESPSDLEPDQQNQSSQDLVLPLDIFSDESIFDGDQIELALCAMEYIDPTLPDLPGAEVKEVLNQIEKEAEQERRLREFNLDDMNK